MPRKKFLDAQSFHLEVWNAFNILYKIFVILCENIKALILEEKPMALFLTAFALLCVFVCGLVLFPKKEIN